MKIRSIRHKGLRRSTEADERSGLPAASIDKIRAILSFSARHVDCGRVARRAELEGAPDLTGNRKRTWALHVTKNWRITFRIDREKIEIIDLDYEDYH